MINWPFCVSIWLKSFWWLSESLHGHTKQNPNELKRVPFTSDAITILSQSYYYKVDRSHIILEVIEPLSIYLPTFMDDGINEPQ